MGSDFEITLVAVAAAIIAINQMLKDAPLFSAHLPRFFFSRFWNYAPAILVAVAALTYLTRPAEPQLERPLSPSPSREQPEPPSTAPLPVIPGGGPLVGFGPEYLLDMVQGRPGAERDALVGLYKGRQMRAVGVLSTVGQTLGDQGMMFLRFGPPELSRAVVCMLSGDALKTAMTLQREAAVTVVGQIAFVTEVYVNLEPCQIASFN